VGGRVLSVARAVDRQGCAESVTGTVRIVTTATTSYRSAGDARGMMIGVALDILVIAADHIS
jgi:hypothetical protein